MPRRYRCLRFLHIFRRLDRIDLLFDSFQIRLGLGNRLAELCLAIGKGFSEAFLGHEFGLEAGNFFGDFGSQPLVVLIQSLHRIALIFRE